MSTFYGPNVSSKNLVFYYDTNNNQSFFGQATENLYYGIDITLYTTGGVSGNIDYSLFSNFAEIERTSETSSSDRYGFRLNVINSLLNDVSGNDLTFSCEYKVISDDGNCRARLGYHDCAVPDGNDQHARGNITFNLADKELNQWYTYSSTWTATGNYSQIATYYWLQDGMGKVQIRNCQLEKKSYATPYTYQERTGTNVLKDLSKYNYSINADNVIYDNGEIYFDGLSSYLIQDEIVFDSSSSWTFSQWQWVDPSVNTWYTFCGTQQGTNGYWMWHSGGKLIFYQDYWDDGDGGKFYGCMGDTEFENIKVATGYIEPGKWINITVSYDGNTSQATAMVNGGQLTETQNVTWSPRPITDFKFKYIGSTLSRYFKGKISTMQVWNKKISLEENIHNYNSFKHKFIN